MHKFGFRLEAVLKLRTQFEDSAKNSLAHSLKELDKQQICLENLENANDDSVKSLTAEVDKGIPVYRIKAYSSYLSFLRGEIVDQQENVSIAEQNVDINREKLVKAMQERKIIEKLKEKKYEEFLKEQNKAEQLLIDELNSYKFKDSSGEENARD